MSDDPRLSIVTNLLFGHVNSPSLRHIRDVYLLGKLADEILLALDRERPVWRKWDIHREALLKSARECWVPMDDLRDYLNDMPGAILTTMDVTQRLRAFHEEDSYSSYPDEEVQPSCLLLYEREKAAGTELPAIIGALQEQVEDEKERLRLEREAYWKQKANEDRLELEQRFLSGAECKWTPIQKSKEFYCRRNGRTYRLSPTTDKMWELQRIETIEDSDGGLIGKFKYRGDANTALAKLAYAPETGW